MIFWSTGVKIWPAGQPPLELASCYYAAHVTNNIFQNALPQWAIFTSGISLWKKDTVEILIKGCKQKSSIDFFFFEGLFYQNFKHQFQILDLLAVQSCLTVRTEHSKSLEKKWILFLFCVCSIIFALGWPQIYWAGQHRWSPPDQSLLPRSQDSWTTCCLETCCWTNQWRREKKDTPPHSQHRQMLL